MILVFAGAGGSKAVNRTQYPTTVEFFQRLPEKIRGSREFKAIDAFLRASQNDDVIDIEQVLWAMHEWQQFASVMRNRDGLPGWLLAENRIAGVTGTNHDWNSPVAVVQQLDSRIGSVMGEINRHVYDFYGEEPTEQELDGSWLPLFLAIQTIDPHIEIVTTNYDVVLEAAIDYAKLPVETGRQGRIHPILNTQEWDLTRPDTVRDGRGLLTKLHGSVDWTRQGDRIYAGSPTFTGKHANHVIIYPGFKGAPTEAPFTLFHQYFEWVASRADAAIFVGFAFRDEYINRIIRDRLPSGTPVIVINPVPSLPFMPLAKGHYEHLQTGLDQAAANKVVGILRRQLRAKKQT